MTDEIESRAVDAANGVVITPIYDFDKHDTTLEIRGLTEGAHVVVSVPGASEEQFLLVGKHGKVHAFGFGKPSDRGPIRLADR